MLLAWAHHLRSRTQEPRPGTSSWLRDWSQTLGNGHRIHLAGLSRPGDRSRPISVHFRRFRARPPICNLNAVTLPQLGVLLSFGDVGPRDRSQRRENGRGMPRGRFSGPGDHSGSISGHFRRFRARPHICDLNIVLLPQLRFLRCHN